MFGICKCLWYDQCYSFQVLQEIPQPIRLNGDRLPIPGDPTRMAPSPRHVRQHLPAVNLMIGMPQPVLGHRPLRVEEESRRLRVQVEQMIGDPAEILHRVAELHLARRKRERVLKW